MAKKAAAKAAASMSRSVTRSAKKVNMTYVLIAAIAIGGIALFFYMNQQSATAAAPPPDYLSASGATGAAPAYTGAPGVEKNHAKEGTKLVGVGEFQYV